MKLPFNKREGGVCSSNIFFVLCNFSSFLFWLIENNRSSEARPTPNHLGLDFDIYVCIRMCVSNTYARVSDLR